MQQIGPEDARAFTAWLDTLMRPVSTKEKQPLSPSRLPAHDEAEKDMVGATGLEPVTSCV